jgi:hypothetical protein
LTLLGQHSLLLLLLQLLLCLLQQTLLFSLLLLWLLLHHRLLQRQRLPPQQQVVGLYQQLRAAHAVLHTLPQRDTHIDWPRGPWRLTGLCGPLLLEQVQGLPEPGTQHLVHILACAGRRQQLHAQRLRLLPRYGML